jgi:DNA-binding PadR family transcriptional regulator
VKINLLSKYPTIEILGLLHKKEMSIREIQEKIPDISRTTLYRHINKMNEENFIIVASTQEVNGLIKKTYKINQNKSTLISKNEYDKENDKLKVKSFFINFIGSVVKTFQENFDNNNLNINFIKSEFHLTNEESKELYKRLKDVLDDYVDNKPRKDRNKEEIVLIHQDLD